MPLHLLVKWEVVSPDSRSGQWESISNIYQTKIVVLVSEPVGGRSWATELHCFPCYTYVCSVMRSYCPEIFVHLGSMTFFSYFQNMKKVYFFHILGLNLKISYQIASLFDMYIYMDERIAGKQDRPSLIIEHPLRAPK